MNPKSEIRNPKSEILFLSYYFPPIKSMGVVRNYHIAMGMRKYFSGVMVLTSRNRRYLAQEPQDLEGLRVMEVPTFDYRTMSAMLGNRSVHYGEDAKKSGFVRFGIKLINTLPFNILVGEGGLLYIVCSFFKAVRLIKRHGVTHIYSCYRPYSDHMIAYCLKLRFPKVCWIAGYNDLPVDPLIRNYFFEGWQHLQNRGMMRKANLVVTVSEGLAKNLGRYHSNIHVMRTGFQASALEYSQKYFDKFTIGYTGSLYGNGGEPGLLLKVISDLLEEGVIERSSIQTIYCGKDAHSWASYMTAYGLSEIAIVHQMVPMKEAIEIQRSSHINLLLATSSEASSGILRGKLNEYLAARNPIVVLISGIRDPEFEKIIGSLGTGIVAYSNDPASYRSLKNYVVQLYGDFVAGNYAANRTEKAQLGTFEWGDLIEKFYKAIYNTTSY